MSESNGLTDEQKNYLQGFVMGADVARAVRGLPVVSGSGPKANGSVVQLGPAGAKGDAAANGPERAQLEAQARFLAQGKTLSREEKAKREKDPLTLWDEIEANGKAGAFPKNTDVFLYKYSGLFFVAPAQDSFMCRLRFPGGEVRGWQLRGIAELAREHGGGHADTTTRANLQIREIGATSAPHVLTGLTELGILNKGAGADNIRNVTATPTSGVDPQELIETLPLAKKMHHYILNHREMYGLPRKFNIAFEGGGTVSSLDDTNDIGFNAVKVTETNASADLPAGVYFRLSLGGITGHKDFARDTGVLLTPEETVPVAGAIVRVFAREGDRTDRKKARLKYVLDAFGFPKFLDEMEKELGQPLRRVALERCEAPVPSDRWGHVGFHPQRQPGFVYVGVILPVGRMTCEQLVGLAAIADRYGSGTIRLTVWQNLLITDIAESVVEVVKREIERIGLGWNASSVRSGLIACTGNAGCKFAGADTKRHAMEIAAYVDDRLEIDQPVNIHVTGCQNSCAQHYIGDIGLEGTKVEAGEEMVEGYHLVVGGGWGLDRAVGRKLADALPYDDVPPAVERLLRHYMDTRADPGESFAAFARRQTVDDLRGGGAPEPRADDPFELIHPGRAMSTTFSLIPDSAPFNPEQRAWLNGFLAGWIGLQGEAGAAVAQPAAALMRPKEAATTEPEPEPWHDPALPIADRLGLAEGKPLKNRLMAAMAQLDCGSCGYICNTYSEAIAQGSETSLTLCTPGGTETSKALKRLMKENTAGSNGHGNGHTNGATHARTETNGWSRKNPFTAKLVRSVPLNKEGSEKETRHVEIDLAGGPSYEVGDSLGLCPENCEALVLDVLQALGASGSEPVTPISGSLVTLSEALAHRCCLTVVTEELLGVLASSAADPAEADRLRACVDDDAPVAGFDVLEVLRRFPSVRPSPSDFVASLSDLKPRLYSISSSPKRHAGQVHLTVRKVIFDTHGRVRKGVASTMLADRVAPGSPLRVFVNKSHGFTIPKDHDAPMVMIGPGTGIAPFRAFLHERDAVGARGKSWLFYGDQRSAFDFLYEDELNELLARGVLTRLDTAFSRDGSDKVYVQHKLLERGAELFEWLQQGAYVYVCGDAKRMASDVDKALRDVVRTHGKMDDEAVKAYFASLTSSGRYARDVY